MVVVVVVVVMVTVVVVESTTTTTTTTTTTATTTTTRTTTVVVVVVMVVVVVVEEKRPGGPRVAYRRAPERVEGPKSTVLSLLRTPGGILTLKRRPHEPREFVCKGTVVLVPRRVASLLFSLPLLPALDAAYLSPTLTLSSHHRPSTLPPPSSTLPFPTGVLSLLHYK
ncbi:unnamed protein product [Xylocopa violacea]|uniref:Uncharacterized protein n=1 Tax=Xylocopa violacea TaxID=135666 RepID=A0ABP1NUV6_XYLVO